MGTCPDDQVETRKRAGNGLVWIRSERCRLCGGKRIRRGTRRRERECIKKSAWDVSNEKAGFLGSIPFLGSISDRRRFFAHPTVR